MKLGKLQQNWVDALRSGNYQQGYNYLSQRDGSNQKYCCLGVLCDLFSTELIELTEGVQTAEDDIKVTNFNGEAEVLPKHLVNKLMLRNDIGIYSDEKSLTDINDSGHHDFADIADLIIEKADDLFLESV